MDNLIKDLAYDYNYNVFLVKAMLPNLETMGEKSLVSRWLQKLESCNKSVDELRLRNEFLYHLVVDVQAGGLGQPFNANPPSGPILTFSHLLPRGEDGGSSGAGGRARGGERSLLYARSPDGGAFLSAQPVPRAGAFAYLAVLCRPTPPAADT